MKRIENSKLTFMLLVLAVVSTSCSISLQKRRYMPGFHISTSKKIGSIKAANRSFKNADDVIDFKEESQRIDSVENWNPVFEKSNKISRQNGVPEDYLEVKEPSKVDRESSNSDSRVDSEKADIELEINDYPATNKNKRVKQKKYMETKKGIQFTKRQLAILIGVSLLLMALIAAFSFPTFTSIFVQGNAVATGLNLTANSGKFVGSIFGWIGIAILDLLVSWGIYKYYKKDRHKSTKKEESKFDQSRLAAITGLLRLIYTLFLISAIVALGLAKSAGSALQSYNLLSAFSSIWSWGLIVFGLHLIVLGITYKKEDGRKWFTILMKCLLILAGIGYMVQNIALLLVPSPVAFLATIESIFMIFMIVGEMAFALWMIIKGGKTEASNETT